MEVIKDAVSGQLAPWSTYSRLEGVLLVVAGCSDRGVYQQRVGNLEMFMYERSQYGASTKDI